MSLLTILIVLVVVGVILWLVNTYVPMSNGWKKAVTWVTIGVVAYWLLKGLGVFKALSGVGVQ